MSELKSRLSGKKPYSRPTCTVKSLSEVGALFRGKLPNGGNGWQNGGASPLCALPILLVEGYVDDLGLIGQTVRRSGRQLQNSIAIGDAWKGMQFADQQDATWPRTFSLLDLRHRRHRERGLLESIGGNRNLSEAIPHVILVTLMEHLQGWEGVDWAHCWQLRGHPSPANLVAALRSFCRLCLSLANRPPEESSGLDEADKYVLIGKTNKE